MQVVVKRKIRVGNRELPLKSVRPFFGILGDSIIESTALHMKLYAYFSRDMIIDKLLAAKIPVGGTELIKRVPHKLLSEKEEPPEPKVQKYRELDLYRPKSRKVVYLPPRYTRVRNRRAIPFRFHPPLTKRYQEFKNKNELDARKLISTGDYIRGIVVRKRENKKFGVYYVVTTARRPHKPSGLSLSTIAMFHEFGTRSKIPLFGNKKRLVEVVVPARPHWRPTFRKLRTIKKTLEEDIKSEAIRKALEKLS